METAPVLKFKYCCVINNIKDKADNIRQFLDNLPVSSYQFTKFIHPQSFYACIRIGFDNEDIMNLFRLLYE